MTIARTWAAAAVLALLLPAAALRAQDKPGEKPAEKPVDKAAEKPKMNPPVIASGEGFSVQSENGDYKLQLRGLVQLDGRFFLSDGDNALTNILFIRRARPIFQGTVAKYFDFNFTPDFGQGASGIQDFYLGARVSPRLVARLGKFKPPIGVEHLQSDAVLPFPERALPASLEPNRDVGLQLSGEFAKGVLAYQAGVFNGAGDGATLDTDLNDGKSVVGRVVVSPFKAGKSALKGLGLGVAGTTEKQSAAVALSGYRTGGQNAFFSYNTGVAPAGTRTRVAPELSYFGGPVGILAEWVSSKGKLVRTVTTAATATTPARTTTTGPFTFDNQAWEITGTVFLTGDPAAYDSVRVKKPFDPSKKQWGALQLAARINQFQADDDTFTTGFADVNRSARQAKAWALGLTWYLSRNVKQVLSFERTTFEGGAAAGRGRRAENALFLRSQLSF